ncbi:MAG: AI-2E family transporter [Thiothrix sp.]|nr:AI-2E family transporter [Thiothrix sp.]HPE61877.1 AI-2E family transporter [Thiolinea sp.]
MASDLQTTPERKAIATSTLPATAYRVSLDTLAPLIMRLLVWGLLFGLLALLSSFFTLIFLTFVFAYLQSSAVDWLGRLIPRVRPLRVIGVGALFLICTIAIAVFLAPRVYEQTAHFASRFSVYMERMDQELLKLADRYPMLQEAVPELKRPEQPTTGWTTWLYGDEQSSPKSFQESPTGAVLELLTSNGEQQANGRETLRSLLDRMANLSRQAATMMGTFLLAFLFSFLIVLDLPHLSASVRGLAHTRLGFIYNEVADNIYQFGKVLGQTMQAQFYIACVNTLLTGLGLVLLGMQDQVAFLSVIVFLCSFIPVAGVFISSVPICLIAINTGGLNLALLCIGLIVVIHMIEGYALNPMIYGARLRINPVIVLIILTVGGKLFHFWGLVLGVPVCTYIFGHAIRYRNERSKPIKADAHAEHTDSESELQEKH